MQQPPGSPMFCNKAARREYFTPGGLHATVQFSAHVFNRDPALGAEAVLNLDEKTLALTGR
jgi:hypothetical protein